MTTHPKSKAVLNVKNLSVEELGAELALLGFERYRTNQIVGWIYTKNATSWDQLTNIKKENRAKLAGRFRLPSLNPVDIRTSKDDTRKFLFELDDGARIESVLIPDGKRHTLCISSQVGCALACKFCRTGSLGFTRNLDQWEILEQVLSVQRNVSYELTPTNIVFMGMGEPLMNYENVLGAAKMLAVDNGLNFSSRHITLSTAGIPDMIERLGRDAAPVNIAVSINSPDEKLRSELMPVNKRHSLEAVLRAIEKYPLAARQRFTFEYIMFDGINDDEHTARKLANLLKRYPCKVNLIRFNPWPGCDLKPSPMPVIKRFQEIMFEKNVGTYIRKSRGADILAACGQLAGQKEI